MSVLGILGYCPDCGFPVWDESDYYYDPVAEEYWHDSCTPKSDKGIE